MPQYYSRRGATAYPIPSSNEPYVYLRSLMSDNIALSARIGYLAQSKLNALSTNMFGYKNSNRRTGQESITLALNFLQQVASAQRTREISFIANKINDLKSLGKIGSEEQIIINSLQQMIDDPKSFNYNIFIKSFNMVITNLKRYISRLQGFKRTSTAINTPQVNLVQQLEATLNDYADYRSQFYLRQEELIRQLTLRFLSKENTPAEAFIASLVGKNGVEKLAAATGLIQQQLAQFLYDNGYLKYNKNDYSIEEFEAEILRLEKKFDEFALSSNINNLFSNESLLNDLIELYGIKVDENIRMYKRNSSKEASKMLKQIKTDLKTDPLANKSKYFQNLLRRVHVTWQANSKFDNNLALQDELISALSPAFQAHKATGHLNLATDMLLGSYSITTEPVIQTQTNKAVQNTLDSIHNTLLSDNIGHNAEKISQLYLNELDKLNTELEDLQHSFILHESNKNFNTLEQGQWPQKNGKDLLFGRQNLNIFNYIGEIQQLGTNLGIDSNWLIFAAYNLADNTLGSDFKHPLETFFGIFAGMLMFDDFAIIGRDIAESTMYTNVTNIHMYKLQDTYFPASVFLDATYMAMTAAKQDIETGLLNNNNFSVSIKAPDVPYTRQEAPTLAERWPIVKTYPETHNKITIEFAANFLQLMRKLL